MKRIYSAIVLAAMILGMNSSALHAQSKTGAANFTVSGSESYNVKLGNKVKLDATFNLIKLGAGTPVSVKASITNTASVKMYYSYNVAFLDKDKNLVGCQHFNLFVDPGKQGSAGTFIQLPSNQIARIAYYSVAFYESDKQIGN